MRVNVMRHRPDRSRRFGSALVIAALGSACPVVASAEEVVASATTAPASPSPAPARRPVLVPGTGVQLTTVGDDFEDESWSWTYNHPKSSEEQDKRVRTPTARSRDNKWFEGMKRGTPDVVKRIPLPAPGLEGSEHGMLIATLRSGVPGRTSYQAHQDDLIHNMQRVTGRGIPVADSPSVVTRVYLPPFEQWEDRSGPSLRLPCRVLHARDHHRRRPSRRGGVGVGGVLAGDVRLLREQP